MSLEEYERQIRKFVPSKYLSQQGKEEGSPAARDYNKQRAVSSCAFERPNRDSYGLSLFK